MEDTIKQLYNGMLYPAEQFQPQSEKYLMKSEQYSKHLNAFSSKLDALSPSLSQELDELLSLRNSLASTEMEEVYAEGFRMGATLIMDILHAPAVENNAE